MPILLSPPTRRRGLKLSFLTNFAPDNGVASHAEAWIETVTFCLVDYPHIVASHAEAWIETSISRWVHRRRLSPPTRRRGLKLFSLRKTGKGGGVASHAEAWIETLVKDVGVLMVSVASHAEAWIETNDPRLAKSALVVASHAEAWIETAQG